MGITGKSVFGSCLLLGVLLVAACTVRLESAQLAYLDVTFTALDTSFTVSPGNLLRIPKNTPNC